MFTFQALLSHYQCLQRAECQLDRAALILGMPASGTLELLYLMRNVQS